MFILLVSYIKPLEDVDAALDDHVEYLKEHYATGVFLCSGRKVPRTGGVILCTARDRVEVQSIIEKDPFTRRGIAEYEVVEFEPTMCAEVFEPIIGAGS